MAIPLEDIDLAELTAALADRFAGFPPAGYLRGRTVLRDAVEVLLACSTLQAEDIVETMIARGFVHYDGDPTETETRDHAWVLRPR